MKPEREIVPINTAKLLTQEIHLVLERNQNVCFLRKLLTRALILEELMR